MSKSIFFDLLKAGLWEKECNIEDNEELDFSTIYKISQAQSVSGLILAGFEHSNVKPPQETLLQWIAEVQSIEQRNMAMNSFIANIITNFKKASIQALLVKGQGVAQCYERPLWRTSGDIDLLLYKDHYERAVTLLSAIASSEGPEDRRRNHKSFTIEHWDVELHGTLRAQLWKRMDKEIDTVQGEIFNKGLVRTWINNETQVYIPNADEDVFLVFTHILQLFFKSGIGYRQICDWCRLLWTYQTKIDASLLEKRLKSARIMSEWRTFAALAVDYLGIPSCAMPLYSNNFRWRRNAKKVVSIIFKTGNMGYNRDYSYFERYPYVVRKGISLYKHTIDVARQFMIFPMDSVIVWFKMLSFGFLFAYKRA